MSFGKFLRDKKLVPEEKILELFFFQLENAPSLHHILKQDLGYSTSDTLKIIDYQIDHNCDVVTAGQKLGHIDEEEKKKIFEIQAKKTPSLAQLIVDKNIMSQEECQSQLDEYHSLNREETVEIQAEFKKTVGGVSSVVLEELKHDVAQGKMDPSILEALEAEIEELSVDVDKDSKQEIDKTLISELQNMMGAKKIVNLSRRLKDLKDQKTKTSLEFQEGLLFLADQFHAFKGCARLIQAHALEESVSLCETLLRKVQSEAETYQNKTGLWTDLYHFFGLIIMLKNSIEQNLTEEVFFSEVKNRKGFESLMSKLSANI